MKAKYLIAFGLSAVAVLYVIARTGDILGTALTLGSIVMLMLFLRNRYYDGGRK